MTNLRIHSCLLMDQSVWLVQAKENMAPAAQKQSVSNYLAIKNKYLRVNLRLMGTLVKVEQYHNEINKIKGEMEKIKGAKDVDYVHFKRILDAYENEKKLTEGDVAKRQKAADEFKAFLGTLGEDFEVKNIEAADLVKLGLFKVENADTVELAVPQIERLKVELAPGRGLNKDLKNLKAKQLRVWQEILHEALKMNKFIDGVLEGKAPYRDESESRLEREV
jgi:hypothetical protein